jgi:hypothetical protein
LVCADSFKLLISPKSYSRSDRAREELKKNELKFELSVWAWAKNGQQPSVTENNHERDVLGERINRRLVKLIFIVLKSTLVVEEIFLGKKNIERKEGRERERKKRRKGREKTKQRGKRQKEIICLTS